VVYENASSAVPRPKRTMTAVKFHQRRQKEMLTNGNPQLSGDLGARFFSMGYTMMWK